jgi:hypothetical protein
MKFGGGRPETWCGAGSTMATTYHLRAELPGLLKRLEVHSLLDAPCGDCNWISQVDLRGVRYTGVEKFEGHILKARKNAPKLRIARMNILIDRLPKRDAILCRDFLQHMPNLDVVRAFKQFRRSGAKWLLATSFDNAENEDIEKQGDFRRLNLEIEPLALGAPLERLEDPPGSGRVLGVWRLR